MAQFRRGWTMLGQIGCAGDINIAKFSKFLDPSHEDTWNHESFKSVLWADFGS